MARLLTRRNKLLLRTPNGSANHLINLHYISAVQNNHVRLKHDTIKIEKIEKQSSEMLIEYAYNLCNELSTSHINDVQKGTKAMKKLHSNLNRILFQLYERNNSNFISYYEQVQKYNLPTINNLNYIAMKYYASEMNFEKVIELLNVLKTNNYFKMQPKHYYPCILLGLKLGKMEESLLLLDELALLTKPPFESNKFHMMIDLCTEQLVSNTDTEALIFVNKVLSILAMHYVTMDPVMVDSILNWFKHNPLQEWLIKEFDIKNQNKNCSHCKHQLKPFEFTGERLISLKENLLHVVKAGIYFKVSKTKEQLNKLKSIMKSVDENKIKTLSNLKKHLILNDGFDVVIDALNVGHYGTKNFDIDIVKRVAYYFREQGKHVLIICSGHLQEGLLLDRAKLRGHKLKYTQGVLRELDTSTSLFFVGKDPVDDHCILYTIMYQDFNIQLVSGDYFNDHIQYLDSENQFDFRMWQKSNQYFMSSLSSNRMFSEPLEFHVALQRHQHGWHLPRTDRDWYCISEV